MSNLGERKSNYYFSLLKSVDKFLRDTGLNATVKQIVINYCLFDPYFNAAIARKYREKFNLGPTAELPYEYILEYDDSDRLCLTVCDTGGFRVLVMYDDTQPYMPNMPFYSGSLFAWSEKKIIEDSAMFMLLEMERKQYSDSLDSDTPLLDRLKREKTYTEGLFACRFAAYARDKHQLLNDTKYESLYNVNATNIIRQMRVDICGEAPLCLEPYGGKLDMSMVRVVERAAPKRIRVIPKK